MSTEIHLKEILKRVEQGLTTCYDAEWLKQYYRTLQSEVESCAKRLKEAQRALDRVLDYDTSTTDRI